MLDDSIANAASCERLSALLDGELEQRFVPETCADWRNDAESRASWHAYRVIGDVLRSDDLAGEPAVDAAFLAVFRSRMALEPVVLAPQPLERPAGSPAVAFGGIDARSRRWAWMAPSAVAAGFMAVAGVLTLTRPGLLIDPSATATATATVTETAARATAPALVAASPAFVGVGAEPSEAQTFVASGQVIRDAHLDRYLAAHKQFAGSSALGVPSANLRNATVESTGRR